mmetsp:Transcript_17370/g.25903  ORF Transcript_17370/g.25903 Transcript_17370/m.25903 type:complete len:83 (+) Transcript_17370:188-436(+)
MPTKSSTPKKREGRGRTYTHLELDTLLSLVEERLPLGMDGWEDLTLEYNRQLPLELSRDMESLRNKFKGLRNKKKPTGTVDE